MPLSYPALKCVLENVEAVKRVNSLNPTINRYFESALPLIHSDSFPLKTLKTTVIGLDTYAHPVIMHAETLILIINTFNEAISLSNIKNLANKIVIVDEQCNTSREYNIFELVKCLRNGHKPIGTTYIFSSYFADIKHLLSKMVMAWRRFSDQLNDMEESRFIPDAPRFSIPMDDVEDSRRIIAYGVEAETERAGQQWKVVIKVVSSI
ncbi:hypothetical protein CRE_18114 [Caenorhabditis remanei]|uniref:Uncharacterized protein n=1 Tax=Caenorhabditis remanei TaxID=31234 RepID=E3N353_CAERE|nr:hypothetical protein CRE_18114 [Caenorhabditis remanei]